MPIQLIQRAELFRDRIAIIDNNGLHTYLKLKLNSADAAAALGKMIESNQPVCIAYMMPAAFEYVCAQWAIWQTGHVALPVCISHPAKEIQYILDDTQCKVFIADKRFSNTLKDLNFNHCKLIWWDDLVNTTVRQQGNLPVTNNEMDALVVYTSGTTGKPKGVVLSHANLRAQIVALSNAWAWHQDDFILNVLPLHHIHGIVNILSCALWNGATCEMHEKFEASKTWNWISQKETAEKTPTLFMAVPTVYHKLIQYYENCSPSEQELYSNACHRLRLMVSGSAALPVTLLKKWKKISGHFLLERYGMSETGMILSNSYENEREAGHVGKPLPTVEVKLADDNGMDIDEINHPGEILVKGPSVFAGYLNKPEATEKAFNKAGWFMTGDVAEINEKGNFRILGRKSSDIIKSGGYKISALEIENTLLESGNISECAVVGLPDEEWGELVSAAIVLNNPSETENSEKAILEFCQNKLAPYKLPRKIMFTASLPRNGMGKVIKQEVKKLFS